MKALHAFFLRMAEPVAMAQCILIVVVLIGDVPWYWLPMPTLGYMLLIALAYGGALGMVYVQVWWQRRRALRRFEAACREAERKRA